jgi:DNA gyrase inhibitor GyrI
MKYLSLICMLLVSFSFAWAQEEAPVAPAPEEAPVAVVPETPPVAVVPETPIEAPQFDIQVKTLPPTTALMTHMMAKDFMPEGGVGEDVNLTSKLYSEMIKAGFGKIMAALEKAGAQMAGPPWVAYPTNPKDVSPENWDCVCFIPVPEGTTIELPEGIQQLNLPERMVAWTLYVGPYDKIEPAYGAMMAWVPANGYAFAGPPEEVYLNDPAVVPPEELQTEVCFPIIKPEAPMEMPMESPEMTPEATPEAAPTEEVVPVETPTEEAAPETPAEEKTE